MPKSTLVLVIPSEMATSEQIIDGFRLLQDHICQGLEELDGQARFREDLWDRPTGGGGRTRIIQGGQLIEKGGVNFSAVHGPMPESIQQALKVAPGDFLATGVSIVLHPHHPRVPIIHMNVRYFEMSHGTFWFGGGIDLTPHYVQPALARQFHEGLKATCDAHHTNYYPKFKEWADDYFYLKHRKETRGVGGIFFDHLSDNDNFSLEDRWAFVQTVGHSFLTLYQQQIDARNEPVIPKEKEWQLIRRGRYVEFNLVWDKGTKFGLETDGRTESILMSLPAEARWAYDLQPDPASEEGQTLSWLRKGIDWVNV